MNFENFHNIIQIYMFFKPLKQKVVIVSNQQKPFQNPYRRVSDTFLEKKIYALENECAALGVPLDRSIYQFDGTGRQFPESVVLEKQAIAAGFNKAKIIQFEMGCVLQELGARGLLPTATSGRPLSPSDLLNQLKP